ncbi:restriction endonuclease subunit S [Thiohalocapsa halophila]|uniref:restriction endonuclease subunit S n=1 Tax=Thiohalocapsa halophila TaxID=69359 RepID=UPI0019073519|nr:restriction endonuclease subunit S [Thiohalocapsa halophila]
MDKQIATFQHLREAGILDFGDGYRAKNAELGGDGPVFLRSAYLQDNGFVLREPDRFKETTTERFGAKAASVGDVVITTKGNSTGRIGLIRETEAGAIYSPHLSYWRSQDATVLDQRYLYFWSLSYEFRGQLHGLAYATDMAPYLSLKDQAALTISIPPLQDQVEIGDLLGALDDKIELNRQTNETLEVLARAIFKDWFVDFGPTRAKAEGRAPYLEPALWDLFPDRLDAERKPEGWDAGSLTDVADLNPESWTKRNAPDAVEYVDLSNTNWGTIDKTEMHSWASAPSRARRILKPGDTIVGTVRPGNGSYAFIAEDGLTGSTGFAVLRPKSPRDCALVWLAATAPENIERLAFLADGAAYPAVRPDVVANTEIVLADPEVIDAFSRTCGSLLDRIEAHKAESRTLAQTRDLLLPKLMSGEIRLRDAERIVGEAA